MLDPVQNAHGVAVCVCFGKLHSAEAVTSTLQTALCMQRVGRVEGHFIDPVDVAAIAVRILGRAITRLRSLFDRDVTFTRSFVKSPSVVSAGGLF